MAGHTIAQTQRKLQAVTGNQALAKSLDFEAMTVITSLAQAAGAVRNRIEQGPLATAKLSWSAYLVLWIVWTWQPIETREIVSEAGLGKPALSGILATLEKRELISRKKSRDDARLVQVSLTVTGQKLIEELLPQVNAIEAEIAAQIHENNRRLIADTLSGITTNA
ncbi:MAG: hypothetical protein RLZZ164_145 [Actinomycetota bacterium]